MESTSFYMTLPSNASTDIYPHNTAAEFQIRTPRTMYLKNKYEVALAEIQYPHTWGTFAKDEDYWIYYVESQSTQHKSVQIPNGYYANIDDLIRAINSALDLGDSPNIKLKYNTISRKVKVFLKDGSTILLSQGIADVLGFKRKQLMPSEESPVVIADYQADIKRGFYTLYVYCNLCEPQVVGDYYVPLLRAVAIQGRDGDIVTKSYGEPHYVPVNTNKFDTIEINIKNDVGENVPFATGKLICKLHFRPKAL